MGSTDNAPWQVVDYRYNIRGWLTDINDTGQLQKTGQPVDLFAFRINYNNPVPSYLPPNSGVKPLYNGNIAETYWRTALDNSIRGYAYNYDDLNRLTDAYYQKPDAIVQAPQTFDEYLSYDLNGNITNLVRYSGDDLPGNTMLIDDLQYTYANNSNQLNKVQDNENSLMGFADGTNTGNDYKYDTNDFRVKDFEKVFCEETERSSMISDKNKGITSITYNHLNLPTEIKWTNTKKINYLYNAIGEKIQKTVTNGTNIKTTDYLDGFQYNDDILEFFPHAEGYVKATLVNPNKKKYAYNYVFNYTDHLGNIRVSYSKDPQTGDLKILDESHYYPFGLKHQEYQPNGFLNNSILGVIIAPVVNNPYKYKYNGKEWQDELGLGLYDYGARNYDPALGRFFNLDRLSEKYEAISPYGYVANNPVYFVDVNGEWIYINDGSNGSYRYTDGKTQKKNEETGKYEDIDGDTYLSDFVFESIVNLESLKGSGDTGKGLIDHFDKAGNDVNIEYSKGEFSHTQGTILVDWAVADKAMAMTSEGYQESHNFIELGHELAHAKDKNNYAFNWIPFKSGRNFSENEIYASHIENMIRAESGVPLRTQYGRGIAESTLIDNNGNSVHFNTNGTRKIFNSKQSVIDSWNISKGANGGEILKNRYNYYQNHSGGCYCGN